ncbi:hypothetical protein [Thermocrinis sp.]
MIVLPITLLVLLLSSCARVIDQMPVWKDREGLYAVLPFENYTETPYAGYRVSALLEGVLASKGYRLTERIWELKETEYSRDELESLKEKAISRGARYLIYGSVNEFRYKVGIDGEPAVSFTIFVYDTKEKRMVRVLSLSGSGWVHESLGTLTQKLLSKTF